MTLHEMFLIQVVFRSHQSIKMWAAVPFWVRTYSVTDSIWIYRERRPTIEFSAQPLTFVLVPILMGPGSVGFISSFIRLPVSQRI